MERIKCNIWIIEEPALRKKADPTDRHDIVQDKNTQKQKLLWIRLNAQEVQNQADEREDDIRDTDRLPACDEEHIVEGLEKLSENDQENDRPHGKTKLFSKREQGEDKKRDRVQGLTEKRFEKYHPDHTVRPFRRQWNR